MALAAANAKANWLYDTGAKTLTEQGVAEGATAWVLNCSVSTTNLTIAIESATLGANLATIPNNTFNNCLGMHDVYFCAFPTVASAAFSSLANYQTRFFVPRDDADWTDYLADATKVRPWADLADDVRDEYSGRFSGRRPVGLGLVAPYKNQWLSRWSPLDKRTMIILR